MQTLAPVSNLLHRWNNKGRKTNTNIILTFVPNVTFLYPLKLSENRKVGKGGREREWRKGALGTSGLMVIQ